MGAQRAFSERLKIVWRDLARSGASWRDLAYCFLKYRLYLCIIIKKQGKMKNFTTLIGFLAFIFIASACSKNSGVDADAANFIGDWKVARSTTIVSGGKVIDSYKFNFSLKFNNGYDLPPVALTFSGTEGVYEGEAKTAFPVNVVNAFDPFKISWQASTDVNAPFTEMAIIS